MNKKLKILIMVLIMAICSGNAFAVILDISGTVSGTINGEAFTATTHGQGDTETGIGSIVGSGTSSWNTCAAIKNSWICIACSNVCLPLNSSLMNLYDLTGGNYDLTRTFTYPDFSDSSITQNGSVSTTGNTMSYTETLIGTYSGPTDIVGVYDYAHYLIPDGPGSVIETGTATIKTLDGSEYVVMSEGVFSNFTGELSQTELAIIEWTTQSWDGTTGELVLEWSGTIVPEPATLLLFSLGGLVLRRIRRVC